MKGEAVVAAWGLVEVGGETLFLGNMLGEDKIFIVRGNLDEAREDFCI